MELLYFLIIGLFVGLLGSLLGIGGGIVIVPLLVFYWGFGPQVAIGTSVLVVLLNSVSGTLGYMRKKQVCLDAAIKFALATAPGAFLGSYAAEYLQGRLFYCVFGLFFIFVACNMFTKANKTSSKQNEITGMPERYNWQLGVLCSVGVGFLASILGIGGGIIHVPFMAYILKFPVHVAIATSTCILTVSSLAGVISHGFLGHIMWLTGLSIGAGAFVGAQIGVQIAQKLHASYLLKFSSVLVFIAGLKFLLSAL